MKGNIEKRDTGDWVVWWTDTSGKNGARILPLHTEDCKRFNTNGDSQSCVVEFEIVDEIIDLGRHGSTVIHKARLLL